MAQSRYLVLLKPNATVQAVLDTLDSDPVHVYSAVKGFATTLSATELASLKARNDVLDIRLDSVHNPTVDPTRPPRRFPAKKFASVTQVLERKVDYANVDTAPALSYTGTGVKVYVLDCGFTAAQSYLGSRYQFGWDVQTGNNGADRHNLQHGQGIAAMIGGTEQGIATGATIVNVRITDSMVGRAATSDIAAAYDYVYGASSGPSIISISFSGVDSPPPLLKAVVDACLTKGIVVVQSAGNQRRKLRASKIPTELIVVGGVTGTSTKAPYSNYGAVDVFAASEVTIKLPDKDHFAGGTSFASPIVAGIAACYLQKQSSATPHNVRIWLVTNSVKDKIYGLGNRAPNRLASASALINTP